MKRYTDESSDPKLNAQRNLYGRTHYVDDDTLRFHRSRILSASHTSDGLLFYLIESYSADYKHTTRLFRGVVFDVSGSTIDRPRMDEGFKTRKQAERAMWAQIETIDARAVTADAINRMEKQYRQTIDDARRDLLGVAAAA